MTKEREHREEIRLFSKRDNFPIKIIFMDKDNTVTDYILLRTRKDKLILQKPFYTDKLTEK